MRATHQVLYNVAGQSIVERLLAGVPTACTFAVFSDGASDDDVAEFSGTATLDVATVDHSVDVASGRGQPDARKVSIDSTADIQVGRKYLIQEEGLLEWFDVRRIVTDDYVMARYPLRNAYTAAATVKSTYVASAIDNTWIADEGNLSNHLDPHPDWRLLLTATVGGATVKEWVLFDVVRAIAKHGITIHDVGRGWGSLVEQLPDSYEVDQGASLIEDAWRIVRAWLAAIGLNEQGIFDPEVIDEAVILQARKLLGDAGVHPPSFEAAEFRAQAGEEWDRYWEKNFMAYMTSKVRSGAGGEGSLKTAGAYWSK
jgi:hypothetical protein